MNNSSFIIVFHFSTGRSKGTPEQSQECARRKEYQLLVLSHPRLCQGTLTFTRLCGEREREKNQKRDSHLGSCHFFLFSVRKRIRPNVPNSTRPSSSFSSSQAKKRKRRLDAYLSRTPTTAAANRATVVIVIQTRTPHRRYLTITALPNVAWQVSWHFGLRSQTQWPRPTHPNKTHALRSSNVKWSMQIRIIARRWSCSSGSARNRSRQHASRSRYDNETWSGIVRHAPISQMLTRILYIAR